MTLAAYPGVAYPGESYPGFEDRAFFTPPTVLRRPAGVSRLYSHLDIPTGVSVLKLNSGAYVQIEGPSPEQIEDAAVVYLGGRSYEVDADEAVALAAAGYEVTT